MSSLIVFAVAASVLPVVADLDGTTTYHIANRTRTPVTVRSAYSCSAGPNDVRDTFTVAPGKSTRFDCDATAAADDHAIVIYRARTVLCTIHQRDDGTVVVDQTQDMCSADLEGSPEVPLIEIAVHDLAQ